MANYGVGVLSFFERVFVPQLIVAVVDFAPCRKFARNNIFAYLLEIGFRNKLSPKVYPLFFASASCSQVVQIREDFCVLSYVF